MGRTRKNKFAGWMPGLYRAATKAGGWCYYTHDAQKKYIGLGGDLVAARRKLVTLQAESPIAGTVADLLQEFHAHRWAQHRRHGHLAAGTLARNEHEIKQLNRAFAHVRIGEFRRAMAWDYLHKYRGAEAAVSANREISFLCSAYEYAIDRGQIEINPVMGVEYNLERARDRLVSHAELISFCQFAIANAHHACASSKKNSNAGRTIALAAQLSYLTSKAQSQILRINRRTDIDAEGISFPGRKRGHGTKVLWTPALRDVVQQLQAITTGATPIYLICATDGSALTASGLKSTWQRIMRAWIKAAPAGQPRERFAFHDLRAKAVTRLKEDGRIASELTGHTTEKMAESVYDRRRDRKAKAVE